MKTAMTAITDVSQRRTDPHVLMLLVTLASFLSIGLTGCGSSVLDRADEKKFFHGIIVDQEGRPVSGADVAMHAGIPGLWGGGTSEQVYTKSDRNGSFALPGMTRLYYSVNPEVYASAPGYVIDNFEFARTRRKFDKNWPQGNHSKPHIVRAWKFGERRLNYQIHAGEIENDSFVFGDVKELYVKIIWDTTPVDALGYPRNDPGLVSTTEHDDWDIALSLVSNAQDVGVAPFAQDWMKGVPPGTAIRVRARNGGVCQADPVFPFSARNKPFSPTIALNWSEVIAFDDSACFRIFYRDTQRGYMSFLTIRYSQGSKRSDWDCRLTFQSAIGPDVDHFGILNPSGDDCLEYDPEYARKMSDSIWHRHEHSGPEMEQIELKERRRDNPRQALEMEEHMRARGIEVPPR